MADASSSLPHKFMETMQKLLASILDAFKDHATVEPKVTSYKNLVDAALGHGDIERAAIQKWNHDMLYDEAGNRRQPTLYDVIDQRNYAELVRLATQHSVLRELDLNAVLFDEGMEDDDRNTLCVYLDTLNGFAKMYDFIPESLAAEVVPMFTAAAAGGATSIEDVMPNIMDMVQRLTADSDNMLRWATEIARKLATPDGQEIFGSMMRNPSALAGLASLNMTPDRVTALMSGMAAQQGV